MPLLSGERRRREGRGIDTFATRLNYVAGEIPKFRKIPKQRNRRFKMIIDNFFSTQQTVNYFSSSTNDCAIS